MNWWVVRVRPGGADPGAVARHLAEATGQAVQECDDGAVVGCVADAGAAEGVTTGLREAFGIGLEVQVEAMDPVDWASRWRDGLSVHRIGRLEVGPGWLLAPGPGRVVVDPETAFGTGEHGSTRGALCLLDRHLRPGDRVLDVGSGSGILAIGAARLGARSALGIEVDPEAEPVAAANAARNGVAGAVRFVTGDGAVLLPLAGPVEVVVANILRHVNVALLAVIRDALGPGGLAIFAGMESPERPLFLESLAAAGFAPVDEVTDAGWWSVAARRP